MQGGVGITLTSTLRRVRGCRGRASRGRLIHFDATLHTLHRKPLMKYTGGWYLHVEAAPVARRVLADREGAEVAGGLRVPEVVDLLAVFTL